MKTPTLKRQTTQSLNAQSQSHKNLKKNLSGRNSKNSVNTFQTKSLQKDIESLKQTNQELKSYFETELDSYRFLAEQLSKDNKNLKKYELLYNESQNKNNKLIEKLLDYDKNKRFDDYQMDLNFNKNVSTKVTREVEVFKQNGDLKDKEVNRFKNKLKKKKEDLRTMKNEIIPNYEKTLKLKRDEIDILKRSNQKLHELVEKKKNSKLFKKKVVETVETKVEKFHIPSTTHKKTETITKNSYNTNIYPIRRYTSTRRISNPKIIRKSPIRYVSHLQTIPRKVTRIVNNNNRKSSNHKILSKKINKEKIEKKNCGSYNNKCKETCPCLKKLLESHYNNCFCHQKEIKHKNEIKNESSRNLEKFEKARAEDILSPQNTGRSSDKRLSVGSHGFKTRGLSVDRYNSNREIKSFGNLNRSRSSMRNISNDNGIEKRKRSRSKRKMTINLDDGGAKIYEDGKMVKSEYFDLKYARHFETLGDFYESKYK